jgi:hypothetical protein
MFVGMSLHLIKNTFLPLRAHLGSDISCVRELSTCIIIIRSGVLRHRKTLANCDVRRRGPELIFFSDGMVDLHARKYANSGANVNFV